MNKFVRNDMSCPANKYKSVNLGRLPNEGKQIMFYDVVKHIPSPECTAGSDKHPKCTLAPKPGDSMWFKISDDRKGMEQSLDNSFHCESSDERCAYFRDMYTYDGVKPYGASVANLSGIKSRSGRTARFCDNPNLLEIKYAGGTTLLVRSDNQQWWD